MPEGRITNPFGSFVCKVWKLFDEKIEMSLWATRGAQFRGPAPLNSCLQSSAYTAPTSVASKWARKQLFSCCSFLWLSVFSQMWQGSCVYELVTVVTVCTSLAQPQTRQNANMQQGGRCEVPPLVRELLAMMASGRSGGAVFLKGVAPDSLTALQWMVTRTEE